MAPSKSPDSVQYTGVRAAGSKGPIRAEEAVDPSSGAGTWAGAGRVGNGLWFEITEHIPSESSKPSVKTGANPPGVWIGVAHNWFLLIFVETKSVIILCECRKMVFATPLSFQG